jgi:hypothetical protein
LWCTPSAECEAAIPGRGKEDTRLAILDLLPCSQLFEIRRSAPSTRLLAAYDIPGKSFRPRVPHRKYCEKKRRQKAAIVSYSRKFPEQDRAIELVFSLMRQHPEGVTIQELNELMQAHHDKLQGEIAWFNSIDVLIDEGRIYTCPKWREQGYLESLKLFVK